MSRSIHLFRPEWNNNPDDLSDYVVEHLRNGPIFVRLSRELWRLADREDRAAKIEEVLEHAYERPAPVLHTEEIREFLNLLDGLEEALKQTVVDSHSMIAPERLPEMRRRTTLVDLGEDRGRLALYGISEAISQVCELECFLKEALDRGLYLALD
jgi:hypothetical protein